MKKPLPDPTPEQLAIMLSAQDNHVTIVEAGPGCAKSTTIKLSVAANPAPKRTSTYIFAFNKEIVDDLKSEVPFGVTVQTLNSFGLSLWRKHIGRMPTLDTKKTRQILRDIAETDNRWSILPEEFDPLQTLVRFAKSQGYTPKGAPKVPGAPDFSGLCDIADIRPEKHYQALLDLVLNKTIEQAFAGTVDFDDQIYIPSLFAPAEVFPKISYLYIDEAQDLSPIQLRLVGRCKPERLCIVGDPLQCHPAGTWIRAGWQDKKIEDVEIGDRLSTYDTHASGFLGLENGVVTVENKVKYEYSGHIYDVELGGNLVRMTHNHKVLARLDKEKRSWYCTYLMRKGNNFRIGMCSLFYESNGGAFGPAARARSEKADAVWLLGTYPTALEARAKEVLASVVYNLPDIMFQNNGAEAIPQPTLDEIWDSVGNNTIEALKCLKAHGLYLDLPIWNSWDSVGEKHGTKFSTKSFITPICNVDPNVMQMLYMAEEHRDGGVWDSPNISYQSETCEVYGITVSARPNGKRLYLADNIVVHNCIYAFRGSMTDAFDQIKALYPDAVKLPLQTSYRLPRKVVRELNGHNPLLVTAKLEDGLIDHPGDTRLVSEWLDYYLPFPEASAAILCRNNAPLYRAAMACIASHTPFNIKDNGWGYTIIRDLRKVCGKRMRVEDILEAMASYWYREDMKPAQEDVLMDKLAVLAAASEGLETSAELITKIEGLLAKSNDSTATKPLHLSTAHKAKGMEFDLVFHLDPGLIPSPNARTAEDFQQEANIAYVLNSRTKDRLVFLHSSQILIPTSHTRERPSSKIRQRL